jgi:O-antigen ligase
MIPSGSFHRSGAAGRPILLTGGWVWQFLFFLLLGLSAAFVFASLSRRHSQFVVFVALLLVPPFLLLVTIAIPPALASLRNLRKHLTLWHWLWLLLFLSSLVLRIRAVQDINASPADAAAVFRILLVSIVAFILLALLSLRRNTWLGSLFRGLIGLLTIYALVSAVSTIWSVYPSWTLYKSLEYLVDVALLAAVLAVVDSTESYKTFLNWTWALYALMLGAVWVSAIIRPQEGFLREGALQQDIGILPIQLTGVFPQVAANKVGEWGALLMILALCRLLPVAGTRSRKGSERIWYLLVFTFGFVSLILSQTRSALAGCMVGVVLLLVLSRRWKLMVLLSLAGTPLLALAHVRERLLSVLQRGQSTSEFASISSRLDWWTYAWHKFMQHPATGLGAYAAGRFAVMSALGEKATGSVHSDYVEILVGTSIWGLLPMVVALLGTWWILVSYLRDPSLSRYDRQLAVEAIAMLGLLSVRSFFSDIMSLHAALMFLVIVGYAELLRRQRKRPVAGAWSNFS